MSIDQFHPLSTFIHPGERGLSILSQPMTASVSYWYEGHCPVSGDRVRLPRTDLAEAIAQGLMHQLALDPPTDEGKMYGILLVETPTGEQRVLKAFSGLLNGAARVVGWVPPIPGRDQLILQEQQTLAQLDWIKQELWHWQHCPERSLYAEYQRNYERQWQDMTSRHRQRKQERHQQRQQLQASLAGEPLAQALVELDHQSRWDGIERRRFKQDRDRTLQPLQRLIQEADAVLAQLKQQRQQLSRQLQDQLHATYQLTNFTGQTRPIAQLIPQGIPSGTGDCCAPKLLHYAATQACKPLAMAEFWWGDSPPNGDKMSGQFYGACTERCQPLMGFLLSGLSDAIRHVPISNSPLPLPILYEDDWIIVVNKPAGLLSVPGRYSDRQDSVLSRAQHQFQQPLRAVHRLDQDTSGILVLARDLDTYRQLSAQFQQRQCQKTYEAILAGVLSQESGVIDLPLWGDPQHRPYQTVDRQRGKPSLTIFQVLERTDSITRIQFKPTTGRTHQLRVHAADSQGLGIPILGDRLYGGGTEGDRLYLHAQTLVLTHPQSGHSLHLHTETSF